jgi:class 3 adenylate cyclase
MGALPQIRFWGVRGSVPTPQADHLRHGGGADYTVVGDTVNVASRLESTVASPGQIAIGESTHDRVKKLFRCGSLDKMQVKGPPEGGHTVPVARTRVARG